MQACMVNENIHTIIDEGDVYPKSKIEFWDPVFWLFFHSIDLKSSNQKGNLIFTATVHLELNVERLLVIVLLLRVIYQPI